VYLRKSKGWTRMRWTLNRYSYAVMLAIVLAVALAAALRRDTQTIFVVALLLALAAVPLLLRGGRSRAASWSDASAELGNGHPTLLFVYSDT